MKSNKGQVFIGIFLILGLILLVLVLGGVFTIVFGFIKTIYTLLTSPVTIFLVFGIFALLILKKFGILEKWGVK